MCTRSQNRTLNAIVTVVILLCCFVAPIHAETEEEAYTKVIEDRAAKIVEPMGISDAEQAQRVQTLIVNQYRGLRDIHAKRDADKSDAAQQVAKLAMFELHNQFVSKLSAELNCEQVEQIKDGLTYSVMPRTYQVYLEQLPDLNDDQKRTIKALLIEARELAMDGGSADEKHGVFRKYKGKINNYLSKAGYKM
jgi:isoleucyl-tRNA synthetase